MSRPVMLYGMMMMMHNMVFMMNRVMGLGHRDSRHGKENDSQ